jgi:hypothetical protein
MGVKTFGAAIGVVVLALAAAPLGRSSSQRPHLIDEAPTVIREPGRYLLEADLDFGGANGAAIRVEADDVTLDLDGHRLRCTIDDPARTCCGIHVSARNRVQIRNGAVEGFATGVLVTEGRGADRRVSTGGHVLENLHVIRSSFCGIRLRGYQSRIARCAVATTGGSKAAAAPRIFGIESTGSQNAILSNNVLDTFAGAGAEAVAIAVADDGFTVTVEGNSIANRDRCDGLTIGVWAGGHTSVLCRSNFIDSLAWGVAASSSATISVVRNTFVDCERPQCIWGYPLDEMPAEAVAVWTHRDNIVQSRQDWMISPYGPAEWASATDDEEGSGTTAETLPSATAPHSP